LVTSIPDWANQIQNNDTRNKEWFADNYFAENFEGSGKISAKVVDVKADYVKFEFENERKKFAKVSNQVLVEKFNDTKEYKFDASLNQQTIVKVGDVIKPGDAIAKGDFTNNTLYKFIGRVLLLSLFIFISIIVYVAYKKRVKEGRATL